MNANWRRPVIWILGSLVAALVFTFLRGEQIDTRVYRTAALRFVAGEQIYRPSDSAAFTYPPFFVLAYVPFAVFPQPWDRTAWCACNLLLLGYILHLLRRFITPAIQAGVERTPGARWVPHVVIGVMALRFVITPLEYQGHDLIVFACFMTALTAIAADRYGRSGAWAGIAAACKATPLLLTVLYFWQRKWRALAICLLAVSAASLLPDLLVANPDRPLWVQSWHEKFLSHVDAASAPQADGAWNAWNMLNQSLSGTLYRLGTEVTQPNEIRWNVALLSLSARQVFVVTAFAKVFVLLLVTYAVWPSHYSASERPRGYLVLNQGAAVLLGMLLLSPMSSKQHFCVLLVPISVLVIDWLYYGRSRIVTVALAVTFLFGTIAGKDIVGAAAHKQLGAYGSLTWCTLICLVACADVARRCSLTTALVPASHAFAIQTRGKTSGMNRSRNQRCEELAR